MAGPLRGRLDWLINGGLLCGSVIGFLLLVEGAAYMKGIRAPDYRLFDFFQHDSVTGYSKIPGSSGWHYAFNDGTRFRVENNSHGFTDREWKPTPSGPRVALIGDSTTEFWEVPPGERPQDLLQDRLREAGMEVEVMNFGVRGYGPDQVLLMLENRVLDFEPDVVVYTFAPNDFHDLGRKETPPFLKPYFELDASGALVLRQWPVPRASRHDASRGAGPQGIDQRLIQMSYTYRAAIRPTLVRVRHALVGPGENTAPHFELRPYLVEYDDEDQARSRLARAVIGRMNREVTAAGGYFVLLESPYKPVIHPSTYRSVVEVYGDLFDPLRVTRVLRAVSETEGFAFISLPEAIEARGIDASVLFHREENMHMNASGAQLFVSELGPLVERLLAERDSVG